MLVDSSIKFWKKYAKSVFAIAQNEFNRERQNNNL